MAQGVRQGTTRNPLQSAANFVRRRARAVLESGERSTAFGAEKLALIEWGASSGLKLPHDFCCRFVPVSSGAEHLVYHDQVARRAIKLTRPNAFGHSAAEPGGRGATATEYLRRLTYHNLLFGDDVRLLGLIQTEDSVQVVSSQPWITAHAETPNATVEQIDDYFERLTFVRSDLFEGAVYYSKFLDIVAADAHSLNVLISEENFIVPIDVVIGRPGDDLRIKLVKECELRALRDSGQ